MRALTRLDDFVVERVAQPVVDRVGAPLREQVRFLATGVAVATAAKLIWLHGAGKLDALAVGHAAVFIPLAAVCRATPNTSAAKAARNPCRVAPLWRALRLYMLAVSSLCAAMFAAHLAAIGWATWPALVTGNDALVVATLYVAACDDPPPPAPKAVTAPAGA